MERKKKLYSSVYVEIRVSKKPAAWPRPGLARAHFWMGQAMGSNLGPVGWPARRPAT